MAKKKFPKKSKNVYGQWMPVLSSHEIQQLRGQRKTEEQKKRMTLMAASINRHWKDPWLRLSERERDFIKYLILGHGKKDAARLSHKKKDGTDFTPSGLGNLTTRLRNRPQVQLVIADVFRDKGIDTHEIGRVILDGMNAMKTKINQKTGAVVETEIPDHAERRKNAKLAADLLSVGKEPMIKEIEVKKVITTKSGNEDKQGETKDDVIKIEEAVKTTLLSQKRRKNVTDGEMVEG